MSRFDRRMGTGPYAKSNASTRKYTPNPNNNGKLPSRNEIMSTQSEKTYSANIIDDVSEKNERILKKLDSTKISSERILLIHELRLNNIELNIDYFNNIEKPGNDLNTILEQEKKIEILENNIDEISKKLMLLTQMMQNKPKENVQLDVNDIVKNVNDNVEKIIGEKEEGPTFE